MTRRLFGDAAVNVLLNGLVNVITYVLMVLAGRSLSKADYGLYQALLAILTIGTVIAQSVQLTVTRETVLAGASGAERVLERWAKRASTPLFALLAALLVSSPLLTTIVGGDVLDLATTWSAFVFILGFSIVSGVVFGIGKPRLHAGANFIGALFRLAAALVGAWTALSVPAWLFVYAIQFLIAGLLLLRVVPRGRHANHEEPSSVVTNLRSLASYVTLAMPFFLDQLLVQVFSPAESGDYAVLMLFAKIGYFASVPLYVVLFPHLVSAGRGGPWKGAALLGAAAIGMNAILSLIVVVAAPFFIPTFFNHYSFSWEQLALAAGSIFFYPPAHLGVLAVVALGARSLSRFLAPVFLLQISLYGLYQGGDLYRLLWIQLITMGALFVLTAVGVWRVLRTWKPAQI